MRETDDVELLVLCVRRPGEHRGGGEVGPVLEAGLPRPSLLQPLRRRVPRRCPLHPHKLPRRQDRDQNQGDPRPTETLTL